MGPLQDIAGARSFPIEAQADDRGIIVAHWLRDKRAKGDGGPKASEPPKGGSFSTRSEGWF
jgi:hypothetical protein